MKYNKLDNEYYVMSTDGEDNHPLLSWGATRAKPFRGKKAIEDGELELPLRITFDEPYPLVYEMADLLSLAAIYAISSKLKNMFERENIYGAQFFPVEIETNKGNMETGYFAMHVWNRLAAIDKKNYEGGKPDELGLIMDLKRFSLDEKTIDRVPFEQRKLIRLAEDPSMLLAHQSIHDIAMAEGLAGIRFWKLSEWDTGAAFR